MVWQSQAEDARLTLQLYYIRHWQVSDPASAALDAASAAAGLPAFGKDMRNKWFTVDPTIAFLNHG